MTGFVLGFRRNLMRRFDCMPEEWKDFRLGEYTVMRVYNVQVGDLFHSAHCHLEIRLTVPEVPHGSFLLLSDVYTDSWEVRKFRYAKLEKEMDEEDDEVMNGIDRLRAVADRNGWDVANELERRGAL
jgi:hypothetical protein